MKTYLLEFWDPTPPRGVFLGACAIDVTVEEAADSYTAEGFVEKPSNAWLVAALQKAHARGCNPGGQVQFYELPDEFRCFVQCDHLFSEDELDLLGERLSASRRRAAQQARVARGRRQC